MNSNKVGDVVDGSGTLRGLVIERERERERERVCVSESEREKERGWERECV